MKTNIIEPSDPVLTSISKVTLPTYELLDDNPNPVFKSQYGVAHIYPYTLQDHISSTPKEKNYLTLILENNYLRVSVLPGLGGRVYSVYDKISNKDVFYKNPVIKFSPLAIRGAFFSGGVEFSFPVAHAPTTAEPVNWDLTQHDDGSASIILGGQEHIGGLRWMIKLTLFPDRCALAQDVWLYNPTPIPGRYHYWTNASLDSDDTTEFIYPLQRVRSYEFEGTASWPVARLDLITGEPGLPGMEGVPMWPAFWLHDPIEFNQERNMLAQVSIFGREVERDFFGAWHHSTNTGYAHYANHKDVSGMKLWSWGRSPVGIVNQTALMDDGSLYAETQCGAMETQLDFDWLKPGGIRKWREWWLPLRDIGGLTCASSQVGVSLKISQESEAGSVEISVGICPVQTFEELQVRLSIPGRELIHEVVKLSPDSPWTSKVLISSGDLAEHPITLKLVEPGGQIVLDFTHQREPGLPVETESLQATTPQSAEDYYQLGLKHENFDNRSQAMECYRESISRSFDHAGAAYQLGLMLLRAADFSHAEQHLKRAASLGISTAYYFLGLLAFYKSQLFEAKEYYQDVPQINELATEALCGLAGIYLKEGRWVDALEILSSKTNPESEINKALLAGLAYRCSDHREMAIKLFSDVLEADSLNLICLHELSRLDEERSEHHQEKLLRMLSDDRQYILDMACQYLDAGLWEDALGVIEKSLSWDYPMIFYLAAFISQQLGLEEKTQSLRQRASQLSMDRVFPSRIWEVISLESAIIENEGDCKARYYLGNFYYAHQRFDEAIKLWEYALSGLGDFDIIQRNLGIAYWQHRQEPIRAIEHFEKALALNKNNQDLYFHLDDLYRETQQNEKRQKLLVEIQKVMPLREDLRKRAIQIMVEIGQYEQALSVLEKEKFVPLEMDQSFHWVYVQALQQKAEDEIRKGNLEDAVRTYRMALEFPENHGVGKPLTDQNAEILYQLGCAYERLGKFRLAVVSWQQAAHEQHRIGDELFKYVQMSLDKLGRYLELGFPN